jgi:hypothetical protein
VQAQPEHTAEELAIGDAAPPAPKKRQKKPSTFTFEGEPKHYETSSNSVDSCARGICDPPGCGCCLAEVQDACQA